MACIRVYFVFTFTYVYGKQLFSSYDGVVMYGCTSLVTVRTSEMYLNSAWSFLN